MTPRTKRVTKSSSNRVSLSWVTLMFPLHPNNLSPDRHMSVVTCLVSPVPELWTITTTHRERDTHPDRGVRVQRTARPPRVILSLPIRLHLPPPPLPFLLSHNKIHNTFRLAFNTDTRTLERLVSATSSYFLFDGSEGLCLDHSALSHQRGPSFDPYSINPHNSFNNPQTPVPSRSPPMQQANPYTDQYSPGGNQYLVNPHSAFSQPDPYQNPYTQGTGQGLERAYTLGGSGYGDNTVPDSQGGPGRIPNPYVDSYGNQPPARTTSPTQMYREQDNDRPPTYDEHYTRPPGVMSSKS